MSLVEAFDHPALFGPQFRMPAWAAWRAFLAALMAAPLSDVELATYSACTGRLEPPRAPFREAALIVGRRGGKSRILAAAAVFLASFKDYTPYLAAGEVATVAILAANRSQARSIFRYVTGLLKAVEPLAEMIETEQAEAIHLSNRVVIEISTASFRTTRGYSFAAVLCDEIAFWSQDESAANPDTEILRALRPGLASIPGSMLLMASSPYAKRGELYSAFRRHYGQDGAKVLVWKAATETMNPTLDRDIIAEAYEADPEAARAEYGAEFRDDLADFVTREVIDTATMWGRSELPPEPGVVYSAFCDPSGGASDAMTLAIAHLGQGNVLVLDAVREARPPFDPESTVLDFALLLRRYGINQVVGDRYGGEWPRQRFREHGITYEPSARPKSDLYRDLLPLLNAGRVELLDHRRLSAELVGLERRTARSGRDSIDHTPGGHDDIANAVAGVLVALDLDRRPALIRSDNLLAEHHPAPMPRWAWAVFSTLVVGQDGMVGIAYFAQHEHHAVRDPAPLTLLDFAYEPLTSATVGKMFARLEELKAAIRQVRAALAWVPASYLQHVHLEGYAADVFPDDAMNDLPALAIAAAGHVNAGRFKVAQPAAEKANVLPLAGALSFRPGDTIEANPLRLAVLLAIELGLSPETSRTAPVRMAG